MFFKAVEENVLKDGKIDVQEAKWLRDALFADGKIDAGDSAFMEKLNKAAKEKAQEFSDLFAEVEKRKPPS